MAEASPTADARDIAEIARIFKCVSHAARLRVLLALATGAHTTPQLRDILCDLDSATVAGQLDCLNKAALIRRRKIGQQASFSLSKTGLGIVHSYPVILANLGYAAASPADEMIPARASDPERAPTRQGPPSASPRLIDAATLLNHAANPIRLRLLFTLMEGPRYTEQLFRELDGVALHSVSQHLDVLESGSLVTSHRTGLHRSYSLALNGLSLVQLVRTTCSSLTIRRGELILRPEPIKAGADGALDPTSPEGLACLLRAFAHPIRLRVLNVLVAAGEVCWCHLPEILQLRRSQVYESLGYPRKAELVLYREEGPWVFLRPAPAAGNLLRSLLGCFGLRLSEADILEADRLRLQDFPPCTTSPKPTPQDAPAPSSDRDHPSGRGKPATRTA